MAPMNKRRQNSNVFAMFDKAQVMEFKDAFSIMDTNSDGLVDMNDLKITFERLGQPATEEEIKEMLGDATTPINFTVFLTLMADKLADIDSENVLLKAFSAFDDDRDGKISADYLRECMMTMGDRFTSEEVDIMFKGSVIDEDGNFNYRDFVRILKHGE
ncbi:Putative Myosin regulatory light chain 2 [Rhizopus microsporus]|nr:Putative Myosin regulatory light chain 2 [Rhizopus microsporus]